MGEMFEHGQALRVHDGRVYRAVLLQENKRGEPVVWAHQMVKGQPKGGHEFPVDEWLSLKETVVNE